MRPLSLVPTGAESTWLAGLWGASLENSPKRARHLFWNFEDGNLRHVVSAAIRNAEVVPAVAQFEKPNAQRGPQSQMSKKFFRIFARLEITLWKLEVCC